MLSWIFLISLLNFSFWPEDEETPFGVEWWDEMDGTAASSEGTDHERRRVLWTGYKSLPALINRALESGIDILSPSTWVSLTDSQYDDIFRSSTESSIPLYSLRVQIMRDSGRILLSPPFNGSVVTLVGQAQHSALKLVESVATTFPSMDDKSFDESREIKIRKRAQIFVAELWAAFEGNGIGRFEDIDSLTCFADYRIPQILQSPSFSILSYSPQLLSLLRSKTHLKNGSVEEVAIRANTIVAVDLLVKEMRRIGSGEGINAVKVDFWLWEEAKRRENTKGDAAMDEFHRTRSCFY
ncbi:hypothetical protein BT69DRAFT_1211966 [Atractiella rhizophila]|nr:hypothetical protein BT69DRAFT_1211966 [Atractiella rhizophila]